MTRNLIRCRIVGGKHNGERALIPRIALSPSDVRYPFTFTRLQFPLILAYAVTINKAQGQTFERMGLYLPQSCFSHGQLFVAMSRVGGWEDVQVLVMPVVNVQGNINGQVCTRNVVYDEVINAMQQGTQGSASSSNTQSSDVTNRSLARAHLSGSVDASSSSGSISQPDPVASDDFVDQETLQRRYDTRTQSLTTSRDFFQQEIDRLNIIMQRRGIPISNPSNLCGFSSESCLLITHIVTFPLLP